MHFLSKIIIGITAAALIGFVACWSFTNQLTTASGVSKLLSQGGVYEEGAKAVRTSVEGSLTAAQIEAKTAQSLTNESINKESLTAATRQTTTRFVEWLKSSTYSGLEMSIDMTSIKSQMARMAKLQGSYDAAFIVAREIPDQLMLVRQEDTYKLRPAYDYYHGIANLVRPLGLASLIGLGLLVLFGIRLPHKRLAWPGWAFIIAGVVGISLGYVVPFVLRASILSPTAKESGVYNGIILAGLTAILATARVYWYVCAAIGAGLLLASMVEARRYHKSKKKH